MSHVAILRKVLKVVGLCFEGLTASKVDLFEHIYTTGH